MKTIIAQSAGTLVALFGVMVGLAGGCSDSSMTASHGKRPPAPEGPTITLNQVDNGAVGNTTGPVSRQSALPRLLAFEMAGFSRPITPAQTQEDRVAAAQAATIDALCQALIEARRSRGQSVADFTAQLGPRLTVTHCVVNGGYQIEVDLISRGVKTAFLVRDGVLQHPPHDLKLLQQVFAETNGEFSLLGAEWSPDTGTYVARVGCYVPAEFGEALAGEAVEPETVTP